MPLTTSLASERLLIEPLSVRDDHFILNLLNTPSWITYIGDRDVHTLTAAQRYITNNIMSSYELHGHGLLKVSLKANGESVGICGLLQRDYLDDPDLGFAILPIYEGQGIISESSRMILAHARDEMHRKSVCAITTPENLRCHQLLDALGFLLNSQVQSSDTNKTFLHYTIEL